MTFLYFAYGSNLWHPQVRSRCPSARVVGSSVLAGWEAVYDKPSLDGSAKLNLRESSGSQVRGVLYEIGDDDRVDLDRAEPGYTPFVVRVVQADGAATDALTYRWLHEGTDARPYDWYVDVARRGARHHGLPDAYVLAVLGADSDPDPMAPGIIPAGAEDLEAMQAILSAALVGSTSRYTIHPGDLAWWMWHDDPRHPDHLSYWMTPDRGVLVLDSRSREINAFTVPGTSVTALVEWGQRRFGGEGEAGWVADSDLELVEYLEENNYRPTHADRLYHWDLARAEVPEPELPDGWQLRAVEGEAEADAWRRASHAAFDSTMDPHRHLARYLEFMRSPVYDSQRDLVAVAPDGQIASFMIWWPDESGIAQIEPFGTHPTFRGRGAGRALIHHGLRRMREEGMGLARVVTEERRSDATGFYQSVGFTCVDRIRWWKRDPRTSGA